MSKIVIIGAGLTGLSTAYHLEKKGFFNYELFEKEAEFGGLCRSIYQDGFTFDFTGHLLHISDDYFDSLLNELVGKENLNSIYRRSFVYSHETYTPYPFQMNLFGLPPEVIIECIEGFVSRKNSKKEPKSFYQWVMKNFGSGFGKNFFFPFQTKLFDYDIKKISSEWTGRFVPQTSLKQIISGAMTLNVPTKIGYNSQFFYPQKGGIFYWIKKIAENIRNPIHTNFEVQSINLKNKYVIFKNGHKEDFDKLITTMPLDIMLDKIEDSSTTNFSKLSNKLVCNSVVNFNLGISRSNISDKHWIYFPEDKFPFYRIGFNHNFSSNSVPTGCSSLYGEFGYTKKSAQQIEQILEKSISQVKELFKISDSEILTQKIIYISRAYVIYNFWRQKNLNNLHKSLQENLIFSIGRYGQWKYSSMQEAVLDGRDIVERVILK